MKKIMIDAYNEDMPIRRKINIPEHVNFGLEIENNGLSNIKAINDAERVIYNLSPELQVKDDRSLSIINMSKTVEQGFEVVTPVMHAKKDDIELLKKLSSTLKHIGPKYNLSSFQINFDDNLTDEERLYLLKLYTYYEPVIARFCRGKDQYLRSGVNIYAGAIYYKILNSIKLFDHPKEIVDTFTNNKMLAINFKNRPIRLIEFRLPNGTNEYTLWFNYINAFYNLLKAAKEKRIPEKDLDALLMKMKEHYNTNYQYQYKQFPVKEDLASDFAYTIFDDKEDGIYFLQQYLGEEKELKKHYKG